MKILKAVLIQLSKVVGWGVLLFLVFGVYILIMEYILEPVVEWLDMGYGLGVGFFLIFAIALIGIFIYAFASGVKATYKNL